MTPEELSGELKVKNFTCSEHGLIKPEPICPKCRHDYISKQKLEEVLGEIDKNAKSEMGEHTRGCNADCHFAAEQTTVSDLKAKLL